MPACWAAQLPAGGHRAPPAQGLWTFLRRFLWEHSSHCSGIKWSRWVTRMAVACWVPEQSCRPPFSPAASEWPVFSASSRVGWGYFFFFFGHSDTCVVVARGGFMCILLVMLGVFSPLHLSPAHPLVRPLCASRARSGGLSSVTLAFLRVLYIFWMLVCVTSVILRVFLLVCSSLRLPLTGSSPGGKPLILVTSNFSIFPCVDLPFGVEGEGLLA